MKGRLWVMAVLAALWIGCWGCSKGKDNAQAVQKASGRPPAAVEITKVQARDLTEGIEVVGALTPKFEARIRSEYVGIVSEVYVTEWLRVKKGTPLAKLDSREIEAALQKSQAAVEIAKANVLQAEVAGNRAERELSRAQNLKAAGLITQQNMDDTLTEKTAAGARLSAAQAQRLAAEKELNQVKTRLAKAVIHAPLDGVVSARNVNVGDLVGEPGATRLMFEMVDNRLLYLTVTVPSLEMDRLQLGQTLTFSTDVYPGKIFTGKVKFINPAVNEADRSVKVIAEVPNVPEVLKAGLFVKGRIITGHRQNVLQIPRTALLSWDVAGKKGEVFVVLANKSFRKPLQTGSLSGDWVEVVSGLQLGEGVITRGSFNVKEGDAVKVVAQNGGQ